MKIHRFQTLSRNGQLRIQAELCPEDGSSSSRVLWYETASDDADGFECSADPFLLMAYMLAALSGESRCLVKEQPVCPHMVQHLPLLIYSWNERHGTSYTPPDIIADAGMLAAQADGHRGRVHFVSGGVDAMSSLYTHVMECGEDERLRDALCVFGLYGFDCPEGEPDLQRLRAWQELKQRMSQALSPHGITVRGAATNARSLFADYQQWSNFAYYATTASVAHAFRQRWRQAWLASDGMLQAGEYDTVEGMPDALSSANVWMRANNPLMRRQQRIERVAAWPAALAVLQPCHHVEIPAEGQINCGHCEKCIRTMLALMLIGALDRAPFPPDVTPNAIRRLRLLGSATKLSYLTDQIPGLRGIGRHDLVRAIRRKSWQMRWRRLKKVWRES